MDMKSSHLGSARSIKWAKPPPARVWRPAWGEDCDLIEVLDHDFAVGLSNAALTTAAGGVSDSPLSPVLVEWRSGFKSSRSASASAYRLNQLVFTLQKMSDASSPCETEAQAQSFINFRILRCLGWIKSGADFTRVGLVYSFPHPLKRRPISLNSLLRASREEDYTPSLTTRIRISQALSRAIANFAAIGWCHREIRSHNVLLFDEANVTELYVVGFCYAHPGDKEDLSTLPERDSGFQLYRPPASLGFPATEMTSSHSGPPSDSSRRGMATATEVGTAHDVFGLGILLLELGFWRTIQSLNREVSRNRPFSRDTLNSLVDRLGPRTGDTYRDVVRKCLMLEGSLNGGMNTVENLKSIMEDLLWCKV
jgi:hypothetical protein